MKGLFSIAAAFTVAVYVPFGAYCQPEKKIPSLLEEGIELFDKAHYDEALKDFLAVAGSDEMPSEDKLKAHYYLVKIYRAYGDEDKMTFHVRQIMVLSPDYSLSKKEPASLKKLFEKIRKEAREDMKEKPFEAAGELRRDMAVLEQKITGTSSENEILGKRVEKQEKELKKVKASLYTVSVTLFLLLAASVGFR